MAVLGFRGCVAFSLIEVGGGYSLVAACRFLTVAASLVGERGLEVCGYQQLQLTGLAVAAHGLSCSGACGIFPDQGFESTSPTLASGFFPAEPLGKP